MFKLISPWVLHVLISNFQTGKKQCELARSLTFAELSEEKGHSAMTSSDNAAKLIRARTDVFFKQASKFCRQVFNARFVVHFMCLVIRPSTHVTFLWGNKVSAPRFEGARTPMHRKQILTLIEGLRSKKNAKNVKLKIVISLNELVTALVDRCPLSLASTLAAFQAFFLWENSLN